MEEIAYRGEAIVRVTGTVLKGEYHLRTDLVRTMDGRIMGREHLTITLNDEGDKIEVEIIPKEEAE